MNQWQLIAERFRSLPTDAVLHFCQNDNERPHWRLVCQVSMPGPRPYREWLAVVRCAGALLSGDHNNADLRWFEHLADTCNALTENHEYLHPCYYDDRKDEPFGMTSWELHSMRRHCEHAALALGLSVPSTNADTMRTVVPAMVQTESGADDIVARVLAGDILPEVAAMVEDSALSMDEKMRKIGVVYHDAISWPAHRWARLLGVTDGRIRQLETWKKWRAAEKKPD